MKRLLFFRELDSQTEEHPVDKLVHERVGMRSTHRKLPQLSAGILKALGLQSKLWFAYEDARANLYAARVEAYFDAGVEHGIAAAMADELKTNRDEVKKLARKLLREALSSGVRREDAASAAVLVAWSLLGTVRVGKQHR